MSKLLDTLSLPQDLQRLSIQEMEQLAAEIRALLKEVGDTCGGHFASNLGVVELTIALHALFDSPTDKFVFDTSHQTYVHKILTGRKDQMFSIRQFQGLSGFAKISESEHDSFGAGHAATSLSAALGMAQARDITHKDFSVVAIAGDAAFSCGMSFEALNNLKDLNSNFICVLNDNDMSISPPIGHMAEYMTKLRTSKTYNGAKRKFERIFAQIPRIGTPLVKRIEKTVERLRDVVLDTKFGVIFEEFGCKYIGPIDGHDFPQLIGALRYAKDYPGPIFIHVHTVKGKGHERAEENPTKYHGVSPKKPIPDPAKIEAVPETYTQVFGKKVVEMARDIPNLAVITPAMETGSGLNQFAKEFPNRYFDVGIAEEHAVTFSAGLATSGVLPVLAIYSTFLQRGYDQLLHDICIQKLKVILALDRAGLVGEDGPTHHGVFDFTFCLPIPHLNVLAPKDGIELRDMLDWAVTDANSTAIRYPRGAVADRSESVPQVLDGKAEILRDFRDKNGKAEIVVIGVGSMAWPAAEIVDELNAKNISSVAVNLRFIKPLDTDTLSEVCQHADHVFIVEEGAEIGGVGQFVAQKLSGIATFHTIGLPDVFVEHGKVSILKELHGLSKAKVLESILATRSATSVAVNVSA